MKENAERQEVAEKYAKCSRRARAANISLRSSRYIECIYVECSFFSE